MKIYKLRQLYKKEIPFFLIAPALVWQILFFYVPLIIIVALSFSDYGFTGTHGITLSHFYAIADYPHVKIIVRSLLFAFISALVCLIIAYPVAYFLARKIKKCKNILLFFLLLPFWTNVLVQIYAWFFVLGRNGIVNTIALKLGLIAQPLHLLNTLGSIFLVMTYCYLPFMILPLYTILEKIDERLIESSYDLGANGLQTFFKVTLPLSWSGIKTGFFLVFVPAFGEFAIPTLMGGSKTLFVGSMISHYFLTAHNQHIGSAFTIASGFILMIIALLLNLYFSKKVRLIKG